MIDLRHLEIGGGRAGDQLSAAFFIVPALAIGGFAVELDLRKAVAILPQLGFNAVSALGTIGVLGAEFLHGFVVSDDFPGDGGDLDFEFLRFMFQQRELAGEHDAQFAAHFIA